MLEEEYCNLRPDGQEQGEGSGKTRLLAFGGLIVRLASGGWLIGSLAACSWGDAPPPAPPDDVMGFSDATEVRVEPAAPGLAYYGLFNREEPWAIHLLRMEMARCELGFEVLEAPVGNGEMEGRNRVSELVAGAGESLLAAVNGDFFTPEGLPVGTEVVAGVTRRIRNRPAFAWRPHDDPWMGIPRAEGDSVLELGWDVSRPRGDGGTQVIGGFPLLLQGGNRVGDLGVADRPSFAAERHPRTAVGFDVDDDLVWIVVVDGRQQEYSAGMTLPELAGLMEALGVEEAVNLDGGGSSVMVLGRTPVSKPSDAEGERPVVNALGIRRDPDLCRSSF